MGHTHGFPHGAARFEAVVTWLHQFQVSRAVVLIKARNDEDLTKIRIARVVTAVGLPCLGQIVGGLPDERGYMNAKRGYV